MLLCPSNDSDSPLPSARGRAILGFLDEVPRDEALASAGHALGSIRRASRPGPGKFQADHVKHSTLCARIDRSIVARKPLRGPTPSAQLCWITEALPDEGPPQPRT